MNKQFTKFAKHVPEMSADEIKRNFFKKEDAMTPLELALLCAEKHTTSIKWLGYAMSVSFDKSFIVGSDYWDENGEEGEWCQSDDVKFYADTVEDAKLVALKICKNNGTSINELVECVNIDIDDIL